MGSITFKAVVSDYRKADGTQTIRIRVTANRKVKAEFNLQMQQNSD